MASKGTTPKSETLQREIMEQSRILTGNMNAVLPFQPSYFRRKNWTSHKAIITARNTVGVFDRVWLERRPAPYAERSPIALMMDQVLHPESYTDLHLDPTSRVVAVHYPRKGGLEIEHILGTPQQEILDRINTLGSYVTKIAEAEFNAKLSAVQTKGSF